MKKKQIVFVAIGIALIGLGLFAYFKFWRHKEEIVEKALPSLLVSNVQVTHITEEEIKMLVTLVSNNPIPVGVTLDSLRYTLFIEGQEVLASTYNKEVKIVGGEIFPLSLPVTVLQKRLKTVLKELERLGKDSVEYKVEGVVHHALLPKEGLAFEKSKRMPLVHIPKMKVVHTDFKRTVSGLLVTLTAKLNNPNVFGIDLTNTHYTVKLQNHKAFEGDIAQIKVAAHDSTEFAVPIEIDFKELGSTIQDYMKKGSDMKYDFTMQTHVVSKQKTINGAEFNILAQGTLKELKEAR